MSQKQTRPSSDSSGSSSVGQVPDSGFGRPKKAVVRSFSFYEPDLKRIEFLRQKFDSQSARPVSDSAVMRFALKRLEQELKKPKPSDSEKPRAGME